MGDEGDSGFGGDAGLGGTDGMGGMGDMGGGLGGGIGGGINGGLGNEGLGSVGDGTGIGLGGDASLGQAFGMDTGTGFGFGFDSPFSIDVPTGMIGFPGFDSSFSSFGDVGIGQGEGLGGFGLSESAMGQDEGILGKLTQMAKNMAISKALSQLGVPAPIVGFGKGILGAINAQNPTQANQAMSHGFMNSMMGMIGLPGLAAQGVMGLAQAAGMPNQGMTGTASPTGGNQGGSMGGGMLGNALTGLASLYGYNRANQGLNGQIQGLEGLFSPNSAYAQQLRQTLERKDAAAGRRSQYGPRETQLMAALADRAAGMAPTLNNLYNQQNQLRDRGLNTLLSMANRSGLTNWAGQGLQGLWNSGISSGVSGGWLPTDTSGMNFGAYQENPFSALGEF